MRRRVTQQSWISILLAAGMIHGCSHHEQPAEPALSAIGQWPPGLMEKLQIRCGTWIWRWQSADEGAPSASGPARLTIVRDRYYWTLRNALGEGGGRGFVLVPRDTFWLSIRVAHFGELSRTPPLPRLGIDSTAYPDLIAMLRELTTPRFGGVVTHWPDYPVPVRSPTAVSGAVDLEACLREAVEIWNTDEPEPHFVWQPGAAWGVRLAYYDGSNRRPPLQVGLTRRDAEGRPLAMRISVGNNYSSAASRPYAVRGMAHELGHAMLLWGHSPDRQHLLWADAPPLRNDPSEDERRAVRLLRCLPSGLDLNRYGQETEP